MNHSKTINMFTILKAWFTIMAFNIQIMLPNLPEDSVNNLLSEIIQNIRASLICNSFTLFFCFLACCMFYMSCEKMAFRPWPMMRILNVIISFIWLIGESYRIDNSLNNLILSPGQLIKSVIFFLGAFFILNGLSTMICNCLREERLFRFSWPSNPQTQIKVGLLYLKHTFTNSFIILIIAWLPHVIIAYPGYSCPDAFNQLAQYLGIATFSSHHPPVSTLIIGGIVEIGSHISGNAGIFLYIVLQMVLCAAIIAYMLSQMKKLGCPLRLLMATLVVCIFCPYYSAYICAIIKDNMYSYFFVLFMTELICLVIQKEAYFKDKTHLVLWNIAVIAVLLLRNNGKYVVYPMIIILIVYSMQWNDQLVNNLSSKKTAYAHRAVFMLFPVVVAFLIQAFVMQHYQIERGSIAEALSLPIQQTARYVKKHEQDIPENERMAIDAVLDYDSLAQKYDPRISDPVKNTFNKEAEISELVSYFSVWLKEFTKDPAVYFNATANQNYYLFDPLIVNSKVYSDLGNKANFRDELSELLQFHSVKALSGLQENIRAYYALCFRLPVLGMISHPATYIILLLWLFILAVHAGCKKWLIIALPNILNVLVIILSPVIQGSPRYTFPIVYTMPIVVGAFLVLNRKSGREK